MEVTQAIAVLGLLAAMLALNTVHCRPQPFPFPQPVDTSQGATNSDTRMPSQRQVRYTDQVASDEAFGALLGFGRFVLNLFLNRIADRTNGTPPNMYTVARGQRVVVDGSEDLMDSLVGELVREYEDSLSGTLDTPTSLTRANDQVSSKEGFYVFVGRGKRCYA